MSTTTVPVCRICLAIGASMFNITGSMQSVYERLTSTTLHSANRKPEAACYICYAQLRKCQKFILKATKAENVLNALLEKNSMITMKSISLIDRGTTGLWESLAPSIVECFDNIVHTKLKVKTENSLEDVNIKDENMELDVSLQPLEELVSNCSDQISDSSQDDPVRVEQLCEIDMVKEEEISKVSLQPLEELVSKCSDQIADSSQDDPVRVEQPCEIDMVKEEEISKGGQLLSDIASLNFEGILDSIRDGSISPVQWDTMSETHDGVISEDMSPALKTEPSKEKQTGGSSETQNAEESHVCAVCHRLFINNADLLRHFRSVHISYMAEKPFKCRICDCRFVRHSDMLNHLRNHSGGKHYQCHICPRQCNRKYELVKHIRSHTGEKCDTCERLFNNDTTEFLTHISTHNSDKRYPCRICHRRFNLKENLIKHCKNSYW